MKHRWLVITLVVLLVALVPAVAWAQDSNRGEVLGTNVRILGQPFESNGPAKDVMSSIPGQKTSVLPATAMQKLGLENTGPLPAKVLFSVKEEFEGAWPTGNWSTFDNNGGQGGNICWDDENWIAEHGNWSGWGAGGCADGLNPNFDYYVDNMDSWAVYGPFSTAGAKKAAVKFWYWNDTEPNYDYLMWCASADGVTFYCKNTSGSTNNKWKRTTLNLKNVPGYGKMLGDSSVWVAWIMTTDGSVSGYPYDGSFIDGVAITVTK